MFLRPLVALNILQLLQHVSITGASQSLRSGPAMEAVKAMVGDKIKANKVMVFSKSYCPYCKKAKNVLGKYPIKSDLMEVMELDLMADQSQAQLIQEVMKSMTGASSVPRVFVNGKFIGGGDDTEKLDKSGELKKLLVDAGAVREEL